MNEPDLPAMPEIVSEKQNRFRELCVTQTHCVVTWIVSDSKGNHLFKNKTVSFICRSDDGSANMKEPVL